LDDIVKQAMAKWPNVPDCCGWLGLDARGDWYMRDDAVQAKGTFPLSKGSRLVHDKLIAFIGRNYAADEQGRWFFQNGPQRVFVDLECTPFIARLTPDLKAWTHTGLAFDAQEAWTDEEGLLYLSHHTHVARVHTQDMMLAVDWLDAHHVQPQTTRAAELPLRFHFVQHPQVGL
jgi:Protein of unknown function (DUF2946)